MTNFFYKHFVVPNNSNITIYNRNLESRNNDINEKRRISLTVEVFRNFLCLKKILWNKEELKQLV